MKIRKYVGKTANEAMNKMREELGPNAVILNAKTVKESGLLGFFKAPKFEVTAAYEEGPVIKEEAYEKEEVVDERMEDIKGELAELRNLLERLPTQEIEKHDQVHEKLKPYLRIMVQNGVNFNIAYGILNKIEENTNLDDKSEDVVKELLKFQLREVIGDPEPISVGDDQKKVFFIGATGVGKTTTLAKIAASLVMEKKYDIGLITSDTYRIGAVDQLKIYGDILDLPLEVAYNAVDMKKSFDSMKDKDIVLIDTAGRSHNDEEQIEELKETLNSADEKDIYLVLSGTSDIKVLENLVLKYNFLEDFKIMVTKLDESAGYGSIFNICYIFGRDVPYYTMGQKVPEDISILYPEEIINKLIEEI